ncbi:MAG: hypothetical protein MJE77_32090 [Proteobacteria bacterium]|nr:hypothetical protein [Pseudomonadota bacterium]
MMRHTNHRSPITRRYAGTAGNFLFTLDQHEGSPAWVKSVAGGEVKGVLVSEPTNIDYPAIKHLVGLEVQPITVELAMGVTSPIFDWIQAAWSRRFSRRSGAIVHANFQHEILFEQAFQDALVVQTTFPTLDASDHNPAYLTVKIQPEFVRLTEERKGNSLWGEHKNNTSKQWCPANFRMELFDLHGRSVDCRGVKKIESFSIKQHIARLCTGANSVAQIEPTRVEFPNLTITLNLSGASDFLRWHNEFITAGGNRPDDEKQGFIEFLDPSCRNSLMYVDLCRVGIQNLTLEKSESNAAACKLCKVELYVEAMELSVTKPTRNR